MLQVGGPEGSPPRFETWSEPSTVVIDQRFFCHPLAKQPSGPGDKRLREARREQICASNVLPGDPASRSRGPAC
ncbi:hypothetical protein MRX96_005210 [Rhipicephalus microplus]